MSTTISHVQGVPAHRPAAGNPSFIERFLDWATKEDVKHHIGWVGFSIIAMTAVFFPVTMAAIKHLPQAKIVVISFPTRPSK